MAVQRGEGTVEIIYGSTSIPLGPIVAGGYLARPDGIGGWPTAVVTGPEPTPTSSVKNMCRRLARHGIAALAPDLTDDHATNARLLAKIADFIADPSGHWSSAQYGFGLVAFGAGIYDAAALAASDGRAVAVVTIGAGLDDHVVELLEIADAPALTIVSRADEAVDVDATVGCRDQLPRTTFVVYRDAGPGWWDDDADEYDEGSSEDTLERVTGFLRDQLPPRI